LPIVKSLNGKPGLAGLFFNDFDQRFKSAWQGENGKIKSPFACQVFWCQGVDFILYFLR